MDKEQRNNVSPCSTLLYFALLSLLPPFIEPPVRGNTHSSLLTHYVSMNCASMNCASIYLSPSKLTLKNFHCYLSSLHISHTAFCSTAWISLIRLDIPPLHPPPPPTRTPTTTETAEVPVLTAILTATNTTVTLTPHQPRTTTAARHHPTPSLRPLRLTLLGTPLDPKHHPRVDRPSSDRSTTAPRPPSEAI